MKHLFLFIGITTAFLFSSCEGDPGPPGFDGEPGINILGQVFEANVSFTNGNGYESLVSFPSNVTVFESDVILVYWLEDVVSDGNGGSLDVWSPLPQTLYLNGLGSFQYTFNHTFLDILLFLQGDFNLNNLGSDLTTNQIFRIAVVPSEFADATLTMTDLLQQLEIETSEIEGISN